ncbi:MAG: hypothetical protein HY812_00585 [Planctomycetes bacterium]|nr:hypothetical protein [Planctomycetota bacterium]
MTSIRSCLLVACLSAALARAAAGQAQAYLVDSNLDQLFSVDLATGAATPLASTANHGLDIPADLTWRGDTSELWTIDLSGGEAGTIDVAAGTFTPLLQTGQSGWQGMAWDPVTQLFYLSHQNGSSYVLDPVNGATTLLGPSGFSLITCLDVDGAGVLWGIDYSSGAVVRLDKATGVGTAVATTIPGFQGLGIDAATGAWFGANTVDDALHAVDQGSGAATLIGAHGAGVDFAKGFDLVGGACTAPYGSGCMGSGGFTPALSMDGCPYAGQQTTLHLTQCLGGSMSALLISPGQAQAPLGGGCFLLVQATPLCLLVPLGGSGPGGGSWTLTGLIPAGTPPVTIYLQAFVADPWPVIDMSASSGLKVDVH